jgi:uncharacterized membrane protein HdeD (DUF308 family)
VWKAERRQELSGDIEVIIKLSMRFRDARWREGIARFLDVLIYIFVIRRDNVYLQIGTCLFLIYPALNHY